ncbi:uncharacterized protein SCHCODRAFT_02641146 [Schizophyllum commune H4-8]|uniref:Amidohydrolase-related domain-containing protein n=1 Tax=Schizophyllum commune (strain H4-8 / FGSC 9210) TaxID=578458 RepID=D8QHN9_SCHCM|nr:uncharacterized protein SCHCODRAFT_02641146 [Schizophyllum commune H4-8]KAI5887269.1 hypothetical protein SCHCODRAFT_02641146 [Schizophyllum commune H4-8]
MKVKDDSAVLPLIHSANPPQCSTTALPRAYKAVALLSVATAASLVYNYLYVRPWTSRTPLQATSEWEDNVWPIREQTPWDISTDFPYPRKLEYDVQEGTWLRLDVHPTSGDIVFDMIGDLYCISAADALSANADARAKARPVLLGVPHDSDPHFSPGGKSLVFRSDAGLGVENIWVKPWDGCEAADLRPAVPHGALAQALDAQDKEDSLLVKGFAETSERMANRLLREGRPEAQRVTNETFRWVSDARFHPSGKKVIATKWFTSSRSIPAGEGWEFDVPGLGSQPSIPAKSGTKLVGHDLPAGWSNEDYGEQQVGPEQFIWRGNDTLIYSKNVVNTGGTFSYSNDVFKGVYSIFARNLTSSKTETLVDAAPGGASRPELSRDQRTLAFVRRVRDKQALVLKDLETGSIHNIWYGLSYDDTRVSAPMGTYPSFAFTPTDDAIIIWAAGHIWRVPLALNVFGEKVSGGEPTIVHFTAHVEKRIAETLKTTVDLAGLESADETQVHAFKELNVDETGSRALFQGGGATYVHEIGTSKTSAIPALYPGQPYYSPSWVPNTPDLVIHARWSNTNFTSFEIANLTSGIAYEVNGLPLGRYFSSVLCECTGSRRKIAFLKSAGTWLTGDIIATAGPGLYVGELTLPSGSEDSIILENLQFIPSEIDVDGHVTLRFFQGASKLLVEQDRRSFTIDLGAGPDENGASKHTTLATGRMSTEVAVSLDRASQPQSAAFVDFYHVYVAPKESLADGEEALWSKPANATKGIARLSLDGGHDLAWSRDGKKLFWFLGPYLHSLEVSKLDECKSAIEEDKVTFGIACVNKLVQWEQVVVKHSTDVSRLGKESQNASLAIVNATILHMDSDNRYGDVIEGGTLVTKGGLISAVGPAASVEVPSDAVVINANQGYVLPGFIDMHAHWNGFSDRFPASSWELETFLAYGVTTMHNPSTDTVDAFAERTRVERGQLVGPRIFHTGTVIYGGAEAGLHQDIADTLEAHSALVRIKAEGGPFSHSYKNYQLPSRASRQRLLLAARNVSMLCFPEGGMNYDWDLTYIVDGMTTVEHSLPVAVIYDDVRKLFEASGTAYTPTHIVSYGGVMGEQQIWAEEDIPNDPKLRELTRHDVLEQLTESTARPKHAYGLYNISEISAEMSRNGVPVLIGAHGEPPLGLNYHSELWFAQQGGLSNYEVFKAATITSAHVLGMEKSIGSLEVGKLADFVVYPPDVDILDGDMRVSRELAYVARGGRLWDASTMEEVWPVKGRRRPIPPINAD